jgi:hypothetical protein
VTKHGDHSLRHTGSLPGGPMRAAWGARRGARPVMVESALPSTLEWCPIRLWRRYCAPGVCG